MAHNVTQALISMNVRKEQAQIMKTLIESKRKPKAKANG